LVVIALEVVGAAAVVIADSRFQIELDRLVEVGDRPIVIVLEVIGLAAVTVGDTIVWIEPDRLAVVGDRPVVELVRATRHLIN
jgi:hypothetical protein